MSKTSDTHHGQIAEAGRDRANLDRQYRGIGIPAVAAALPFAGKIKNPAKASAHSKEHRSAENRRSILSV